MHNLLSPFTKYTATNQFKFSLGISEECKENEFACKDNGYCIPEYLRCDGHPYCHDKSDEWNCTGESEFLDIFVKGTGNCGLIF